MADNVLINTGTGATVWTDQSGTKHAQVVKLLVGTEDTFSYIEKGATAGAASIPVVLATDQATVPVSVPVLSATNVTVASVATIATGSVSVVNTPTMTIATALAMPVLSASGVTIASIATMATGSVSVVNTPTVTAAGTMFYGVNSTNLGTTGSGVLITGIQATTSRALAIHTTGGLIIASMPAVGGGQQYSQTDTVGSTGTGALAFGVAEDTAQPIALHTTGGLIIGAMPAVGGGEQYVHGTTGIAATGTGTLVIGVQSGATTAQRLVLTTTGGLVIGAAPVLSATGVTIASVATGTLSVVNVLSASNVTIASITTGTVTSIPSGTQTVTVANVISATGVTLAATTAIAGAFIRTAHPQQVQAFAIVTSSASAIVLTSGAHTIYVTDLMVSVDGPMNVSIRSATTQRSQVYLATKGGFVFPMQQPLKLNSAQSLTVLPSSSGNCAVTMQGYTVT